MTHNQTAMVAAHQSGRAAAQQGLNRSFITMAAASRPIDEGDAMLAGYYAELRRMEHNRRAVSNYVSEGLGENIDFCPSDNG